MKNQLKTTTFSALLLSSILIISSCGGGESDQQGGPGSRGFGGSGQATSVEVISVQTGTISDQIRSFGSIQPQDVVQITPQVSNRVTRILVDLGDEVSRGQVMAEIYDVPFRDAVEQAEAQIRQARAAFERDSTQLNRQSELYERELISQSEFDEFRTSYLNSLAQYESSKASLTQSQENLQNTRIKSPVNGVVLNRMIAEGDVASTGQAIFEVANMIGFETRVFLPIQDWELVQVGQTVTMKLSSRGNDIADGIISRKSPQLNATTGLGEVVITLTEASSSVYQGALVQANINLQTKEDVIVIPRSAMVEKVDTYIEPETGTIELDRSFSAFVNQGDSIAVRKELVLGIEQGDRIEVLQGLNPGDGLIITGQRSLENGSRIRVSDGDPGVQSQPATENGQAPGLGNMPPEQREAMRERMQNMTPEQREAMRERMQNMTPEQREAMRERMQNMTPEERREFMQQVRQGSGQRQGERSQGGSNNSRN